MVILDSVGQKLFFFCFFFFIWEIALRSMLPKATMELIIHAFISSRLDYCNSLFTCLNKFSLSCLQMVQNAAARLITETNRTAHLTPVLFNLHWLSVKYRIEFKILVLTFRALHGQTPQYIADMLTSYSSGRTSFLRSKPPDGPQKQQKTSLFRQAFSWLSYLSMFLYDAS